MYNELKTTYKMYNGELYNVERGKVTARIGYEGHGMFGLSVHYDWGVSTSSFYNLDTVDDWDLPREDRVIIPMDYALDLPKAFLKVFGIDYGYLDSIKDAEIYILFKDHNVPAGFVNIRETQNYLLFDEFFSMYPE